MATVINRIRALAGQAIQNLPALKFREGTDKATRAQAEGMLSTLQRGEMVTVRTVASFGARVFTGAEFGGWERTANFEAWQRATDGGGDGRLLEFVAVSEGDKRDGSRIRVDGIDTTNLAKNPVFLWNHNSGGPLPPIGRIVAIKKADHVGLGRVLMIRVAPLATTDGTEHLDFARMIFSMFENGDMHAVSFGWVPTDYEVMYSDDGYFLGFDFLKSDALEVSAVPTPADPDALKQHAGSACAYRSAASKFPDLFTTRRDSGVFMLRDGVELGPLFRLADEGATTSSVEGQPPIPAPAREEGGSQNAAAEPCSVPLPTEQAEKLRGIFAGPVREALAANDTKELLTLVRELIAAGTAADEVYAAVESERDAAHEEAALAIETAERVAGLFGDKSIVGQRAGKSLSRKNREKVEAAHAACSAATTALRDLLDSTSESTTDDTSDDDARSVSDALTRLQASAETLARANGTDTVSVLAAAQRSVERLAALVSPPAPDIGGDIYAGIFARAAVVGA